MNMRPESCDIGADNVRGSPLSIDPTASRFLRYAALKRKAIAIPHLLIPRSEGFRFGRSTDGSAGESRIS